MDSLRIADLFAELMADLGLDRFGVPRGRPRQRDWEQLAPSPERMLGLHITDVPYWHLFEVDPSTSSEMPRGGHFAAWEEPELLAEDLVTSFDPLGV